MLPVPSGLLPDGSRLLLEERGEPRGPGPRSHLADGRRVVLRDAPDGWVLDAELGVDPPPTLARRFGAEDFWGRWTRAECAAKLTRTPIGVWLARHGLDEPDPRSVDLVTVSLTGPVTGSGGLVVSLGGATREARQHAFTCLA